MTQVLDRLRQETRPHHDRLEHHLNIPHRLRSLLRYRALLEDFLGFYQPLEDRLACIDWRSTGISPDERRKGPLIESDLDVLGVGSMARAALPRCGALPVIDGLPAAFGCLYVLEGATLGGQIIARHVTASLPLPEGCGCAFFRSYGGHIGTMWRMFRDELSRHCAGPAAADAAVAAATRTFRDLEDWLGRQDALFGLEVAA